MEQTATLELPVLEEPNPFTDAYAAEHLAAFDCRDYAKGGIKIEHQWCQGRIDDYLNVNFRVKRDAGSQSDDGHQAFNIPILRCNGTLWMSLTPAEIQANWVPWQMAEGHVAVGGLGLGYSARLFASSPNVERVTVFEKNAGLIRWFKQEHGDKPEVEKIEIVAGDVRKSLPAYKGEFFELFYNDIYPKRHDDDIVADIDRFCRLNKVGRYRYWGQERQLLEMVLSGVRPPSAMLSTYDRHYVQMWRHTNPCKLSDHLDDEYMERIRRAWIAVGRACR